ncbi:hypothetical protein Leryth_009955 [Lithospermum erythrorhizon]|nr:hypothetical protein Leryth_009955 [Lithospermum erythrorhizon]
MSFLFIMVLKFGSFLCVTLWSFMFNVFGFIYKFIHRLKINFINSEDTNSRNEVVDTNSDGFGETEKDAKQEGSVYMQNELVSSESIKYQFLMSKDFSGFVMDIQGIRSTVEEMYVDSNDDVFFTKSQSHDEGSNNFLEIDDHLFNLSSSVDESFQEHIAAIDFMEKTDESLHEQIAEVDVSHEAYDDILQENIAEIDDEKTQDSNEDMDVEVDDEDTASPECETETFEISLQQILDFDKDQASNFQGKLDLDCFEFDDENASDNQEIVFTKEDSDADYIELEPYVQPSMEDDDLDNHSIKEDCKTEESHEAHGAQNEEMELLDDLQKYEEDNSENNSWGSDSGDEDEVDILKQHQNLVQQMKMEMRYSKVKGLPTISEDCESPKSVEDMKPLKIYEKFEFKDCMAEIQKFYKSYAEKMRKLDVLNYQKLHAISFLQLKDSEVFMAEHKSSNSLIPKIWPCKMQRIYADSTHKLLGETYQDLELVYIGQVCHTWEILNWQYAKAKELLEHDSQGYRSYNKVATEFQQFQVLMERFVEDEPFQGNGGRIQHYVKNRCVLRSLLHVPMIKDDSLQDRKAIGGEEQNIISVTELAKIIKQSMEVFWEFLSCEKGEPKMIQKAAQVSEVDIHDPEAAKHLMDTKLALQQKERKLKDILRSTNGIVKKFQKCKKGGQNHALFTSQVELKLVSRVLSLSRLTTDQSMWCQRKLDNISFLGRKVHVEPSFWLFPC